MADNIIPGLDEFENAPKSSIKTEKDLTSAQKSILSQYAMKGYTTGHDVNPATMQDGGALRVEFLDERLTMLTYTDDDLVIFKDIARRPSNSTVAQYDIFTSHGRTGHSRFTQEIGIAPQSDPHIKRRTVQMKYLSDTKNVSLAAQQANTIADVLDLLVEDALVSVARTIEWAILYGDADISANQDQGSGLEFDGLAKLIKVEAPQNVIDARGNSLSAQLLNQCAVNIRRGFGRATDAYMPVGVLADFANNFQGIQRNFIGQGNNNIGIGFGIDTFNSQFGPIRLHGSTVMEDDLLLDEGRPVEAGAPQRPEVTAKVLTDGKGAFEAEDIKTGLSYKFVVNSDDSQSVATDEIPATITNVTDSVKFTIKIQAIYGQPPVFVSVFRKDLVTGSYYLISRVPLREAIGDTLTFIDENVTIPGTADVFVGDLNPQTIHLYEFLPMTRLPLAVQNASTTFSILWYGALALKAPRRWAHLRNVRYITDGIHSDNR